MDLDSCNLTELVTMARELDPEAHRGLSRETLCKIINGEETRPLKQRSINKIRLKIMTFINENWEQVSPLISCPAKSRDSYACFTCCDVQVSLCTLTNKDKIEEP